MFKGKAKLSPNCKKFCIGGMEMVDRYESFLCEINEGEEMSEERTEDQSVFL